MDVISRILMEAWWLVQESSVYMIFGILVAGLLRVFLNPETVSRHLGEGSFSSVFKAALLGIPMPLCSCGVLPAAASLKKQGANNGALTAFVISTPESDIDAIALTYALTDPIMTVARPVAGFVTAVGAGIAENFLHQEKSGTKTPPDLSCPVDGCCDGIDCLPSEHRKHHTTAEKLRAGLDFARKDLWNDIAVWYFAGVLVAGAIAVAVPSDLMIRYLGGGFYSMLIMLVAAVPLYVCASASTPIAAALILKGVSPGAALVFLLAGPATNITSITVLLKIMGKKATVVYVASIAVFTLASGLLVDEIYRFWGVSAQAMIGTASEIIPVWIKIAGALLLIGLSVRPIYNALRSRIMRFRGKTEAASCGCGSALCSIDELPAAACGCSDTHSGIASRK
ncbi:MAG: SO_0444 family Cu/Zn efflux transporter [Desulfobacterales bacterium]|nr:SO_0444 family Cu/Zn efflux transporter [Desulfobacterales bacterium]